MVLGHPGQLDVFLARLLTWLQRKPLVLDLLLSSYLVSLERGLDAKSPLSIKFLRLLEAIACRLPDFLICETDAYIHWHLKTHHLNVKNFGVVPVIADSRTFQPCSSPTLLNNDKFNVLYYGSYIPNHGVETIIEAANLLRNHPDIQFEMVGQGPTKTKAEELVNQYQLKNVIFTNWLEKEALLQKITQADIVLGIFGTTLHSQITLHNKIHESLALGKAVITRDSPAIQEAIQPGVHAYLVEAANPKQLVEGILNLQADPSLRELLGQQGQALFRQKYSLENLGQQFKRYLLALIQ
jgi:glycosyltransferase involved in cell wall biosynthesis